MYPEFVAILQVEPKLTRRNEEVDLDRYPILEISNKGTDRDTKDFNSNSELKSICVKVAIDLDLRLTLSKPENPPPIALHLLQ